MNHDSEGADEARRKATGEMLRIAFGAATPTIAKLPHFILPASKPNFRSLLKVVGDQIGVWGNARPLVDAKGDPYLEPPDSQIVSDFNLWSTIANHQHAMNYSCRLQDFIMIIPSDTNTEVLSQLYDSDIGDQSYDYYKCINLAARFIEKLEYAYIPLEPEAELALFVTSRCKQYLVERTLKELSVDGIHPIYRVECSNGRYDLIRLDSSDTESV